MEYLELIKERYSVRSFSDRKVEEEKIDIILEAGRIAPTARNLQPQKIYVLKSEEAMAKMSGITDYTFGAPLVFLFCGDENVGWVNSFNDRHMTMMDVSIVATQMMFAATDIGLGNTWVCRFDTEEVKRQFNLPEGVEPYLILPVGYASDEAGPSENHFIRKELEETVEFI